jgi:2-polyprenyl-6-methoxyphenol hydroxylase-like FAD-dependent oxidoreductase
MTDCTTLIVGAGPVGLTIAAHLHRHGIGCRIVDRSPQPSPYSKALVLWPRTLEMLDALGLAETFAATGMLLGSARIYGGARLLVRLALDLADTRFPRALMLAQNETERLLTEHLTRAGIVIERPVELLGLADAGDQVQATLGHVDGREEICRCDWLLGCDGAHSTVRHAIGAEFTGHAEPNDWMLADCRVEGPIPQDELSLFWHAHGVLAFFPFASGRCRVIADLGPARGKGRPPDPTLADVQAALDERGPAGVRLSEPHWLSGFRINERKVADYRRGRVFLAGDAAHIHSPAGGQGMNTGMQDAWNLAWKLALVQRGAAQAALLDSYSPERSQVGEAVLRNAARLTWLATMRNPLGRLLRNRLVGLLGSFGAPRGQFARGLSELDIHYRASPLNGENSGRRWARRNIRPGDRLPDIRLNLPAQGGEQWLFRLLHRPCHHLLLLPAVDEPLGLPALADILQRVATAYPNSIEPHLIVPGNMELAVADGQPFTWHDPDGTVRRLLGARATALVLVRPDGYVGYRAQPALWDGLQAYLSRYLISAQAQPHARWQPK